VSLAAQTLAILTFLFQLVGILGLYSGVALERDTSLWETIYFGLPPLGIATAALVTAFRGWPWLTLALCSLSVIAIRLLSYGPPSSLARSGGA
jgi:hypothetical protein